MNFNEPIHVRDLSEKLNVDYDDFINFIWSKKLILFSDYTSLPISEIKETYARNTMVIVLNYNSKNYYNIYVLSDKVKSIDWLIRYASLHYYS